MGALGITADRTSLEVRLGAALVAGGNPEPLVDFDLVRGRHGVLVRERQLIQPRQFQIHLCQSCVLADKLLDRQTGRRTVEAGLEGGRTLGGNRT
ncbi:hypothetical protein D3C72_2334970 [compost metagenome]